MNDKKKEELEKMYALRAGLSIISQMYDKLAAEGEKIFNEYRELADYSDWLYDEEEED